MGGKKRIQQERGGERRIVGKPSKGTAETNFAQTFRIRLVTRIRKRPAIPLSRPLSRAFHPSAPLVVSSISITDFLRAEKRPTSRAGVIKALIMT